MLTEIAVFSLRLGQVIRSLARDSAVEGRLTGIDYDPRTDTSRLYLRTASGQVEVCTVQDASKRTVFLVENLPPDQQPARY